MKRHMSVILASLILALGLFTSTGAQEKLKIAVIPKSNTAMFWKSVHAGVKLGGIALGGVEVSWRASSTEEDIEQQVALVEQCIVDGVDGIVLAPLDKDALAAPVAKAGKKKIPVIIYDSALKGTAGKDYISFVGIDNKKAGYEAGQHLVRLLNGNGKVVMLRYVEGQSNISKREEGFLEAIAKEKGIQIIEKERFFSGTIDEAKNECLKMADKLQEADGVFCSYEQSTLGMLLALRSLHLTGKVKFIGFDTPLQAVDALKKGEVSALIAQDPTRMGYLSIKTIVDNIRGKKTQAKVDVDVQVITRENLNNPEIQKILALPSISN